MRLCQVPDFITKLPAPWLGQNNNNNNTITMTIPPECDHLATVTDINTKQTKKH